MTTNLFGFAIRSFLQSTSDLVARGKGYLTNHQPPPSPLLPSSEVPGGEATENIVVECDEMFSFPRFDVLQITP
jgi:hypothetical protein